MEQDVLPGPDTAAALDFLRWWRPAGVLTLSAIGITGQGEIETHSWQVAEGASAWSAVERWIEHWQGSRNLYFIVNECRAINKKPAKDDILSICAAFTDADPDTSSGYERGRELLLAEVPRLMQGELPPSAIIDSGHGLNALWRLSPAMTDVAAFEAMNKPFSEIMGGKGIYNVDRLLRLPGTINLPNEAKLKKGYPAEPTLARLLHRSDDTYDLEALTASVARVRQAQAGATGLDFNDPLPTAAGVDWSRMPPELAERLRTLMRFDVALANRWRGNASGLNDRTRSGFDMSLGAMLKNRGFTFAEMCTVLRAWPHGKGGDNADRDLQRIWNRGGAEQADARAASGHNLSAALSALEPSDTGNARRFLARFGEDVIFATHAGWHVWDGKRFQKDDRREVVKCAQETARHIFEECSHIEDADAQKRRARWAIESQNKSKIGGMLDMAAPHCAVTPGELDADDWLLNVANGRIDLRTGELRPHGRSDRITKLAPVSFDPHAACPGWERFLLEIFDGDAGLAGFMQRALGYSLTGDTREHVLFIPYGVGSNGKTTLLETIAALLGDYAQQAPTETFMAKERSGGLSNDVARLKGARFVSAVESDSGRRLAEGLVKQVTGGDRMTARFLYQEAFEFRPALKLWLATNHRPEIRGTDEGIWRRIRLIPFEVQFADPERARPGQPVKDKALPSRLIAELPGILAWAVRGCLEWQKDGLKEPAKVLQATAEYRADMDQLADFLAERCLTSPSVSVLAKDIYAAYREWSEDNGATPNVQHLFGRMLQERGFRKEKAGVVVYRGLALRQEASDAP